MRRLLLLALLVALPTAAEAMDVQTFLAKADALMAKGMMAMFSGDMKVLKDEIHAQSSALRAEGDAARKAGHPPPYCLPTPANLTSDEIMTSFRAVPAAERPRTSVKEGLRALFVKKYPCR